MDNPAENIFFNPSIMVTEILIVINVNQGRYKALFLEYLVPVAGQVKKLDQIFTRIGVEKSSGNSFIDGWTHSWKAISSTWESLVGKITQDPARQKARLNQADDVVYLAASTTSIIITSLFFSTLGLPVLGILRAFMIVNLAVSILMVLHAEAKFEGIVNDWNWAPTLNQLGIRWNWKPPEEVD